MTFDELVAQATGRSGGPYRWQAEVAEHGLPELIAVETGAGKTEGVVLPWIYRRRFHPDPAVRVATARWLVLCLPLRVLTEQTEEAVRSWLARLGLDGGDDPVVVHVAMGGREQGRGEEWRRYPERDAIVIGTVDMLLSRALNRGYAMSRFSWPIDFGLLHNGCHWVFDETQLLGPALSTGRQLDAFRRLLGTALESRSTWMSATLDVEALRTVDNPDVDPPLRLGPADRTGELAERLYASRVVEEVAVDPKDRVDDLASALLDAHRPGTLTIAVLNTVRAARALHEAVASRATGVPLSLVHSRFRPPDRRRALEAALGPVPAEGRVVVSTQVLEAGVDMSATTMLLEAAPWPSVVQRAGRCNRDGRCGKEGHPEARLLWVEPAKPEPYLAEDVSAAVAALRSLEGRAMTSTGLADVRAEVTPEDHPVLRVRDLLGLFDTAPDLSGNDIDVGPFIRPANDHDGYIAWRELGLDPPGPLLERPTGDELCSVPVSDLRELSQRQALWTFDHLQEKGWVRVRSAEVRPGTVVVADVHAGGYDPMRGWDPASRVPVEPVSTTPEQGLVDQEEGVGEDEPSFSSTPGASPGEPDLPGPWVGLRRHLADVEAATAELLRALDPPILPVAATATVGLPSGVVDAVVRAGRLHDIGKAHEVFQDTMVRSAEKAGIPAEAATEGRPWAKSGGGRGVRHKKKFFRHELASALMLLAEGSSALAGMEHPELVVYLVAAHHGRVRLGIRSVPEEEARGTTLGVADGDRVVAVALPVGEVPPTSLSLATVRLGRGDGCDPSWGERSLALLEELGPFRLGFLESMLRLSDWKASRAEASGESDL